MGSLVNIGSEISKESVEAVSKTIIDILNTKADQATIQKALEVFESTCPRASTVENTTISNCSFVQTLDSAKVDKKGGE